MLRTFSKKIPEVIAWEKYLIKKKIKTSPTIIIKQKKIKQ